MQVQINKLRDVEAPVDFAERVESSLQDAMARYEGQLTRIEVHFGDVNGTKNGPNDKRCSLEARITGHEPVAAVHHADSVELAFDGAIDKLMASLDHTLGRLDRHQ